MVEGLKLAALAFDKDVSLLSCCAGQICINYFRTIHELDNFVLINSDTLSAILFENI